MKHRSAEQIERVLRYLNENVEYALLRNYDGLPFDNTSRDIDIVIARREFARHRSAIVGELVRDGWQLLSHLDNGRLTTYVCTKITDGAVDIVQWDIFAETSVHGVVLAEAEEMVASRIYNGHLYHVSRGYEFLDKYLYCRAVGAPYPSRYQEIRSQQSTNEMVRSKLRRLFGCSDLERLDAMSGGALLTTALLRNIIRKPLSTIYSVVRSVAYYIGGFVASRVAPTIAFTGADGAGKSTIISLIERKLSPIYGNSTAYFHFRPLLIPNLGEAAHIAGLRGEVDREFDRPHRGGRRGVVSSLLRLCYYTLDYLIGYWARVKPQARLTRLIIFDRYFNDMIVDSERSSIYLPVRFLYGWGRLFIPRMRYNILITADVDTILSRKQELGRTEIERINHNMEYLAHRPGYYLVANNGTAEEGATKILSIIVEHQHRRNLSRL